MKKATETMKFRMESKLLETATFSYTDEQNITHTITNENRYNALRYTEYKNGFILEEEFQNISDLMLFLKKNDIDTENFVLEQD